MGENPALKFAESSPGRTGQIVERERSLRENGSNVQCLSTPGPKPGGVTNFPISQWLPPEVVRLERTTNELTAHPSTIEVHLIQE